MTSFSLCLLCRRGAAGKGPVPSPMVRWSLTVLGQCSLLSQRPDGNLNFVPLHCPPPSPSRRGVCRCLWEPRVCTWVCLGV